MQFFEDIFLTYNRIRSSIIILYNLYVQTDIFKTIILDAQQPYYVVD